MNITLKQAEEYIAELRPFISGNLIGQWEGLGNGEDYYCIRSYNTRIAWAVRAQWGINANMDHDAWDYSSTTSKHPNVVKNTWLAQGINVYSRDHKAGVLATL